MQHNHVHVYLLKTEHKVTESLTPRRLITDVDIVETDVYRWADKLDFIFFSYLVLVNHSAKLLLGFHSSLNKQKIPMCISAILTSINAM